MGIGILDRHVVIMMSGGENGHKFVVPHSNSGRCMNLGSIGRLVGAGQPNVCWE